MKVLSSKKDAETLVKALKKAKELLEPDEYDWLWESVKEKVLRGYPDAKIHFFAVAEEEGL